jgi:hypothetical protein
MLPRIYLDMPCPLDGYEGYTFRVLANPTGAEKNDWAMGHLGADDCAACAKLGTPRGKQGSTIKKYCEGCQAARDRMGRAAVAVYGSSHVEGFDFATPESSLATFSMPDLPDELLLWLYMAPGALWAARAEEIKKKLQQPLTNGISSPDSLSAPSRTT